MIRAKCGRSREVGSIFQFTPPRGGRPMPAFCCVILRLHFNSRPRVGGRLQFHKIRQCQIAFQFTPPRGGRLEHESRDQPKKPISIHAPAWGATPDVSKFSLGGQFQFTPPRGGRPLGAALPNMGGYISIHAPAWGATDIMEVSYTMGAQFQFTPPRGGATFQRLLLAFPLADFNSRPRVGGDR